MGIRLGFHDFYCDIIQPTGLIAFYLLLVVSLSDSGATDKTLHMMNRNSVVCSMLSHHWMSLNLPDWAFKSTQIHF